MNNPIVSCLTATYGRPEILGEAVKCFIDQDYNNKELIILNDQVGVELFIENCPNNIRIYNHPIRFSCLGEKRNYMKSLGNGDLFCIWDDDDLYPPFRISESVCLMEKYPFFDIIKAKEALTSTHNKDYKIVSNLFHSQAMITKKYMENNQYPNITVGEDREFERGARVNIINIFPSFWYIYRWGLNVHHVSGIADDKKSWEKSLTFSPYQMQGRIEIKPIFKRNYWRDVGLSLGQINPIWAKDWEKKLKDYP